MANQNIRKPKNKQHQRRAKRNTKGFNLLPRRVGAWVLEISLVTISGIVPYGMGKYTESVWQGERIPLSPLLAKIEQTGTKALALPREKEREKQVSPLTNIFWYGALITPIVLAGSQLYLLGKTGQTLPKSWLGLQVVTKTGITPGIVRAGLREGVGRWGLPVGGAYLLWRAGIGFPNVMILFLLSGVMLLAESKMLLFDSRRRCIHDLIAGTMVVDKKNNWAARRKTYQGRQEEYVVVKNNDGKVENVTTIVISPKGEKRHFDLWLWMRQNPGITLGIVTLASMGSLLLTYVGTQIYIQSRADQRQMQEEKNAMFLSLVNQLRSTAIDPIAERQSVILGLAKLDDPRAINLLVNLLGQEKNLDVIKTVQQGIVDMGPAALPYLQGLNQSLWSELQLGDKLPQQEGKTAEEIAWRLGITQEAIAKLLVVNSGRFENGSLRRTHLGRLNTEIGQIFTLDLNQVDLSGMNFRGAILQRASLRGSIFSREGKEQQLIIADLSGADLQGADFTEAVLTHVPLHRTNLMQTNLNQADLSFSQLKESNLTHANLTKASFQQANLTGAILEMVNGVGTDFSGAEMSGSNWEKSNLSDANFSDGNLQQANLSFTQMKGASLRNAQLENANLQYANLTQVDLRGANLTGADFQGVIFVMYQNYKDEELTEQSASFAGAFAQIEGVDFSQVQNLSLSQIDFICRHGGIHPLCLFPE
ncbi:MAG: pentapeptide repeat-containing protein [Gomphosphaeria aponina SAG 52.96 = DSM 107014]|uniref:Pentapeptide repeat-containing protein n=1 Tax=Gomphosphaeria aponina SAG 52.96 = DSM 107014 TaxID=1521640 RepID=A0A941GWM9_9CHRO|nr:pentapeptide repeat-containing protein [Gomphosphaeria aponina SAG 52.96 = DSM 107014]